MESRAVAEIDMRNEDTVNFGGSIGLPVTRCTACGMTWLTPGLVRGEIYECKNCGSKFTVGVSENSLAAPEGVAGAEPGL
jgi:hypothetical protein